MTQKIGDRTKETTTTTGQGTISLLGAVATFQTFVNGVGNGNSTPYLIDDGAGNWELTWGGVTSGTPDTLTRGTLIKSSTGSRVTFGPGTKTVACVNAAELILWVGQSDALAETTIASATTTDLGTITTLSAAISGVATITSFGTQPNSARYIRFTGTSLVLTHNATSLILPGGRNIQTAVGDTCQAISDVSGNWRVVWYQRAAAPVEASATAIGVTGGAIATIASVTFGPGRFKLSGNAQENGSGAGSNVYFQIGISATTNSFSGTVQGKSRAYACNYINGGTATLGSASLSGFEVSVAVPTTYYLVVSCLTQSDTFDGFIRAEPVL